MRIASLNDSGIDKTAFGRILTPMAEAALISEDQARLIGELDRRFRAPLLAYFDRRVREHAEAEDLTQEVFIRLAQHPDRHGGHTIDSYVFTFAANLLRDRAKYLVP
ncbi:MAG: RNA polymerase sigma factor [Steroidobacteraceae bacterium]